MHRFLAKIAVASLILMLPAVPFTLGDFSVTPASAAGAFSFERTDYPLVVSVGLDSVAVGDLDGKNGPDIVAVGYAEPGQGLVNVLLNNGDGTFAAPKDFHTCIDASHIVVGQFNPRTDNHLDVAIICEGNKIGRMLGDGQGNLGAVQTTVVLGAIIDTLRFGAMNGPTLVFSTFLPGQGVSTLCFMQVAQLETALDFAGPTDYICNFFEDALGNQRFGQIAGDIAMGAYQPFPGEQSPRDEAVGVGMTITGYVGLGVLPDFSYAARYDGGASPFGVFGGFGAVALADVDGDEQNDILMAGDGLITMYVPGFPIPEFASPTHSFPSVANISDMVTADFDDDGKLDIAVISANPDDSGDVDVGIHRGDGTGAFAAAETFKAHGTDLDYFVRQTLALGDFNQDGKPDLVTVGRNNTDVSVLLNTTGVPSGSPTASVAAANGAGVVTFTTDAGVFLALTAIPESSLPLAGKPAGLTFPYGFFTWTIGNLTPGQTVTVTITYPARVPTGAQYWKVIGGVWTNVTSLLGSDNGDNVLTLTITDGGLGDADGAVNGQISDPGGVGIAANHPPVALCQDVTVPANASCQASVSVNNSSSDPDGDPITLSQLPPSPYGLGLNSVTLTATDEKGASASCQATVRVLDQTPPSIRSLAASPTVLWPPNHQMVPVNVTLAASDGCDTAPSCRITSVRSNEPVNGLGDGDTAPDWEITGNLGLKLRAERFGKGNGRVYTITAMCTDASGNSSTKTTTVTVPRDQAKK